MFILSKKKCSSSFLLALDKGFSSPRRIIMPE